MYKIMSFANKDSVAFSFSILDACYFIFSPNYSDENHSTVLNRKWLEQTFISGS